MASSLSEANKKPKPDHAPLEKVLMCLMCRENSDQDTQVKVFVVHVKKHLHGVPGKLLLS